MWSARRPGDLSTRALYVPLLRLPGSRDETPVGKPNNAQVVPLCVGHAGTEPHAPKQDWLHLHQDTVNPPSQGCVPRPLHPAHLLDTSQRTADCKTLNFYLPSA